MVKSVALFVDAAIAEISGAYLVWTAVKDGRGLLVGVLGVVALGSTASLRRFSPNNEFGRVLAAYSGVFIVGSLAWGVAFDGFRPDRFDLAGAAICLSGVCVIIDWPR